MQKIWYQRVWPFLQHEMMKSDVSAAVLHPVIFLIQESTLEDYETLMLPAMRYYMQYYYYLYNFFEIRNCIKIYIFYKKSDNIN